MSKIIKLALVFLMIVVFSGCSTTPLQVSSGNIMKTENGGVDWEIISKMGDKNIGTVNILSMEIDRNNSTIFIGTENSGIFFSKDKGENWESINFPPTRIYGLAINPKNSQEIYASGVWNEVGRIYKSEDEGMSWKEVYTEPSTGTVISSLAISFFNPSVLYAGTSAGMIFKSSDSGNSWENLRLEGGPIIDISFDFFNDDLVYFGIYNQGIVRTVDAGKNFDNISEKIGSIGVLPNVYSLAIDPGEEGLLYVGLGNGIIKGKNNGEEWTELNILESSKNFPIRALAINPKNSSEIIYSAAQAIYKSTDKGVNWATFKLDSDNLVEELNYDFINPNEIYLGMRKIK